MPIVVQALIDLVAETIWLQTLQRRIFGVAILGRVQVRPGSHGSARFDGGCPPMVALRRIRRCPRRPVPALVSGALPYQADPW